MCILSRECMGWRHEVHHYLLHLENQILNFSHFSPVVITSNSAFNTWRYSLSLIEGREKKIGVRLTKEGEKMSLSCLSGTIGVVQMPGMQAVIEFLRELLLQAWWLILWKPESYDDMGSFHLWIFHTVGLFFPTQWWKTDACGTWSWLWRPNHRYENRSLYE